MPKCTDISSILALGAASLLGGCATVRMHSVDELAAVGRGCGLAPGELVQELELPPVLFFYAVSPSRAELSCVRRWSRRHNLRLAYISSVEFAD